MGEKKLIPPCQYTKYAYEKRKKYQTQKMRTNKWHTIEKNKNEKNTIYLQVLNKRFTQRISSYKSI